MGLFSDFKKELSGIKQQFKEGTIKAKEDFKKTKVDFKKM
ncbi:MAG: hypothetical protein ACFWT6_19430 [Virgibacillus proomii]